ncbi:hypothetical protein DAPPUDRAFT_326852 [Daphnia pulex]|uniref:Uncharacterized protein n=1 Tax=Daphnia pulex TaxID=6669 RepID=E9H8Z5_DAPPU|nr:hypothetical protein DAPPUDRAFT_326852 [Daphnia pulex]|eukprot:EFX71810.1 hypothetical protein DAPPUDRAFT_326852 [Daphnia pulex]
MNDEHTRIDFAVSHADFYLDSWTVVIFYEQNFSIAANGFIFECRELQHTERCVSVLGRISIDGPCFVRKVDGLLLNARTCIKHLFPLSESLVVWEPKEKGFYPYRIIQRM